MSADQDDMPSLAQVQAWTNALRHDLMEIAERHVRKGLRVPVPIAGYVFLELGTRLTLIGYGSRDGPAIARQHVEAVLGLIETDNGPVQ